MRSDRVWIGFAAALLIAGCPASSSRKDCPSGQSREGDRCVAQPLCGGGAAACGDLCCAPDQTCTAPGTCRGKPCADASSCDPGAICKAGFCTTYDPSCRSVPEKGPFAPRVAWQWTGSKDLAQYRDVLMTPIVVPLAPGSGDVFTPPAVVFNAIRSDVGAAEQVSGVMRAVRGDDGTDLWASDPAHLVNGLAGIAAGDLRGDGRMVFVTGRYAEGGDFSKDGLIAFDASGKFLWEYVGVRTRWGAPTLANLGGPAASVVLGATVLDADGKLVCQGAFGQGANFMGPISAVADVDLDGKPDLVTGNTVYDAACQPKPGWPAKQPDGSLWWDGLVAVADFTGDDHPEIVVVAVGQLRLHDWKGKLVWGPIPLPGGGAGGPPTVADFDGDGKLEIGVASRSTYTVFKPFAANPVLWSKPTQDHSDVTGSSVFDFENDGRAEVVYGDECYTRVYDGRGGDTLFEAPNPSCTTMENPVVADVNRDGKAELVVATNSVCNFACPWGSQYGAAKGITVFKDLNDRWVSTRAIWNQHAYAVTNVEDDGRLPSPIADHWRIPGLNAFRKNVIGDPNYSAPDLAIGPADAAVDRGACPAKLVLSIRVWNRGALPVAAGVPITFRAEPGAVLGTATTRGTILPGKFEVVVLELAPGPTTPAGAEIRVDGDAAGKGIVGECDEANNVVSVGDAYCPKGAL